MPMALKLIKENRGITGEELSSLERGLGRALPRDLLEFLRRCNGATPEGNIFQIASQQNDSGVQVFLGSVEMLARRAGMRKEFGDELLPVAEAEGGNLVCVDIRTGAVLFWDHEEVADRALAPLHTSFAAFTQALQPHGPSDAELRPEDIISVWVHPDLRRD